MEAELSEMTIKALLYRESRILQMGKFLKRKTWYSVSQWTTREILLIPVWLRFLRHNLRATFDAAPVENYFSLYFPAFPEKRFSFALQICFVP